MNTMPKSLINAANLHVGGGVQVAASVISEIAELTGHGGDLSIAVSDVVASNLGPAIPKKFPQSRLTRMNAKGVDPFNFRFRKLLDQHDKVFTIFGPLYRWRIPGDSIVGFAQPWIIFPDNEVYRMLSLPGRLKTRLKFFIQKQFYKRADILVVELDFVKDALVRELGVDPSKVRVVRNCVSSIYYDKESWLPLEMPDASDALRLGFLGRNYLHKNTRIFPQIAYHLRRDHGLNAKFYVTFTQQEWEACSPEFRDVSINVGPIAVRQCPNFYNKLDAVVFPSLLECFSATPLEAMAMGRPLFASDRAFNREVCRDHAQYFDPSFPGQAAELIAGTFSGKGPDALALAQAREHAFSFSSPTERAKKYLNIIAGNTD